MKRSLFAKAVDLIAGVSAPRWVIKGMLESDALALMYGAPGDGKSFLAFDIACCVATGTPWHGHKVQQGPVVYIAGEGQGGVARRLAAWEKYHGKSLKDAPLYVSVKAVALLDPANALEVVREVEALLPPGVIPVLVVIDTVARAFVGGDENSSQDMSNFVNIVDSFFKEKWKANVMLVHHSGKSVEKGARGSSALKGALDQEFSLEKKEKMRTLKCTKMKDGEPSPDKIFELETVKLFEVVDQFGDLEMITSAVPVFREKSSAAGGGEPTEARGRKPVQVVHPSDLVEFLEAEGEWPGMAAIASRFQCSKNSAVEIVKNAEEKGFIKSKGAGTHKKYEICELPF